MTRLHYVLRHTIAHLIVLETASHVNLAVILCSTIKG